MPKTVYEDIHLNVTKKCSNDGMCKIYFKFWVDNSMNK